MKHRDMLALMGKIVTVSSVLRRVNAGANVKRWESREVTPWAGWVVGFRTLQNGVVSYGYDEPAIFIQKDTIPCVLVAPWPTMKGRPVPLDAFELGGEPIPPDHGGWRGLAPETAEWHKRELSAEMMDWPRKDGKWCQPTR